MDGGYDACGTSRMQVGRERCSTKAGMDAMVSERSGICVSARHDRGPERDARIH
jgi:hypothetical protein